MLGERITVVRLASVVIGFAGVLIVIRPGSSVFQWASLLMLASAIFYAVYQIIVRRVAGRRFARDHGLLQRARLHAWLMSLLVPSIWKTPDNWRDLALMLSLGVSGGFGHYCVARAFSYAPANLIAPLNYTQMIGSVVGRLPDVRRGARSLYLARQRGDHRRRPARGMAGPPRRRA